MTKLNLTANGKTQELILAYLQENVSTVLAEKINNGVHIEKDGKWLVNKKDLNGFMKYATDEARKLAEKSASSACVEDSIVYGWAIHYFEENSIEGKLYNTDGSEYNTPKPITPTVPCTTPAPKPKPQMSLFDLIDEQIKVEEKPVVPIKETDDDDEPSPEEIQEILAEVAEQEKNEKPEPNKVSPMYQHYMNIQAHYPDSIIAYRLGDFYEIFGENAVTIANEPDMTLTGRDCGLAERVPMIGFPYHAVDIYIAKILKHGHKIAIAEDLNTVREITSELPEQVIDTETGEVLRHNHTPSKPEEDILAREREIAKAFDKEALIKLSDLLGDIFTLR